MLYFICSLQENITSIAFHIKFFIFDTFVSSKFLPCLDKADGLLLKFQGLQSGWFLQLVLRIQPDFIHFFWWMNSYHLFCSRERINMGLSITRKKRNFISIYFSFFSLCRFFLNNLMDNMDLLNLTGLFLWFYYI